MSKSLEALEKLYDGYQYGMAGRSFYDLIKQDLERLNKFEKAIDILNDNINHLELQIIDDFPTGNIFIGMTQQDYESLKEVLSNDK